MKALIGWAVEVHTFNRSTWEEEAGRPLSSRTTEPVLGQSRLHKETLVLNPSTAPNPTNSIAENIETQDVPNKVRVHPVVPNKICLSAPGGVTAMGNISIYKSCESSDLVISWAEWWWALHPQTSSAELV